MLKCQHNKLDTQFSKKLDMWVAKCERGVHNSLFVAGDWRGDGCHRGLAKASCFFRGHRERCFDMVLQNLLSLGNLFLEIVCFLGLTSGDLMI